MDDPALIFESAAVTDAGKARPQNEDAFLVNPQAGIWAVADGMGGHDAGELASSTVVAALGKITAPASVDDLLSQCRKELAEANADLFRIARAKPGSIVGTTLAALLAHAGAYAGVWSGDSRIYLIRDDHIVQLTRDHTEAAELVAEGVLSEEEARNWPRRHVVTRAIGVEPELEIEVTRGECVADDIFVLCSDGLTAHVDDAEILAHVRGNGAQSACDALLDLTLRRGATDNVTILILHYRPRSGTVVLLNRGTAPAGSRP